MKREIPPAAIAAVAVLGIAIIVVVWMVSGGNNQLSKDQLDLAKQQTEIQTQRAEAGLRENTSTAAPGSEQEARGK